MSVECTRPAEKNNSPHRLLTWLFGNTQRWGERVFAGTDADARRRGWQVARGLGGLTRTYRDPRFDTLRPHRHPRPSRPAATTPYRRRHVHDGFGPSRTIRNVLSPVARPNPMVLLWRWRYELALVGGLPAGVVALLNVVGVAWTVICVNFLAALLTLWPVPRRWLVTHAWCVITAHRVRTGCAQAWIHSRRGKIPVVLRTRPAPFGERVYLWCRAGTSAEDFTAARALLRTACWAEDVRIGRSHRYAQIAIMDVIRHHSAEPPLERDGFEIGW